MKRMMTVFLTSILLAGCASSFTPHDVEIINELSLAGCDISSFESSKRLDTTRVTCK